MPYYDDSEFTPAHAINSMWRWLPALLVLLLIGGGITYAGHQFGWWLSAQDTTRQAENTQNGYSNQVTLRQQVTAGFATLTSIGTQLAAAQGDPSLLTALRVQRTATADTVCSDAAQVTGTPLPASQASWVAANCADGTLTTTSPDYQAGQP